MLINIGLSNIFLDMPTQARKIEVKINKWNYIKQKKLLHSKKKKKSLK